MMTIRLYLTMGSNKRTAYFKKKNIFRKMGDNCSIMDRSVPLYSNLIALGDNVHIASNVSFITHDITQVVLNNIEGKDIYQERIGCINIGNNVFIGSFTRILFGVSIGDNVIIGAGSIVTKDIPANSVAVGVPAKVVGTFSDYKKKMEEKIYPDSMKPMHQEVSKELVDYMWEVFFNKRKGK